MKLYLLVSSYSTASPESFHRLDIYNVTKNVRQQKTVMNTPVGEVYIREMGRQWRQRAIEAIVATAVDLETPR